MEGMEPSESSTLQTLQMTLFLAQTKDNIPGGLDGLEGLEGLEDLEGLEGIELDGGLACLEGLESLLQHNPPDPPNSLLFIELTYAYRRV